MKHHPFCLFLPPVSSGAKRRVDAARGFALVASLSMMVLLIVLSVGLLSLSAVSLRTSGQSDAMQTARANARLALALAIGQLQKAAGPDQRITAPGNLMNPAVHPALTGAWESRKLSPDGDPGLDAAKRAPRTGEEADGEFLGWLASQELKNPKSGPGSAPDGGADATAILLRTHGGNGATARELRMETLPVNEHGGMAWATVDEGVKARFDLPAEEPATDEARLARLRAPARTAPETLPGLESLRLDRAEAVKMVSHQTGRFAATDHDRYRAYFDDLTPWSLSLPVNVADGGLKTDLTRAFEAASLPSALNGRHIYSNTTKPLTAADPLFSNLAAYYKLHASTDGGTRPLTVSVPTGYRPSITSRGITSPNLAPLNGNLIAPVVTRVSVVFSLISREAHPHWDQTIPSTTGDSQRTYMVYLIYTPVITVYNPYNTPLTVGNLKVTFTHLPLAFQFFRNGVPQTNSPALLSQFHSSSENRTDWEDQFSVTLSNTPGSASGATLTLNPGEARVFGVNHPRGTRWGSLTNYLWQNDLGSSKTLNLIAGPGWNYRSGFIVDWLRPAGAGRTSDNGSLGVFGARGTDTIDVACTPEMPGGSNGQFSVSISARVGSRETQIGGYRYRYGTKQRLVEVMQSGAHPSLGPISYPFRREKPWRLTELYQSNVENTPIEDWTGPKQFAMFTLVDRTAQDSLHPTKPVRHSSFVHQVLDMDVTNAHPAQMPMEMAFMPIRGDGANVVGSIDVAPDDTNRTFHFSGSRLLTGALNFPSYQVPHTPLVNIGSFRHANLASSGHLPLTTYTVGESFAQPLLPADKARNPSAAFGYELTDHAWLANHTLWDACYLSTLRDSGEASRFFSGNGDLPLNPRFTPLSPSGTTPEEAAALAFDSDAWASNAARQAIKGGFNVNSTSVAAWKALLASHGAAEIPVLDPVRLQQRLEEGKSAPLPRMLRGAAGSIDHASVVDNQTRWTGFRDLSESDLDELATEIVAQVRERGPFLSMSEFVNRRLTAPTDETSTGGALELAIRKSGINQRDTGGIRRSVTETEAGNFGYANLRAAIGDTEEGSNAFLSQGDLLESLGATLTVRSDTFLIRAYGDARDPAGRIVATARCEAVVQRIPEFVHPDDAPDKVQIGFDEPGRRPEALHEINQRFGRRFEVVSFRWLAAEEG